MSHELANGMKMWKETWEYYNIINFLEWTYDIELRNNLVRCPV